MTESESEPQAEIIVCTFQNLWTENTILIILLLFIILCMLVFCCYYNRKLRSKNRKLRFENKKLMDDLSGNLTNLTNVLREKIKSPRI